MIDVHNNNLCVPLYVVYAENQLQFMRQISTGEYEIPIRLQ